MEDPSLARAMLEPLRTRFREPLRDFLLYSRYGPRVIRLSIPGVEPKEFRQQRLEKHKPCKVIVVGSGLAGLSAAIEAADARAHVVVLEKEPMTGGNSSKATSGINGWGTYTQALQNVPDDERLFERDTHRSGKGGTTNPSLVRALSIQSAQSIHWLQQKFGIPLTVLSQLGGHSTKRTHRVPPDENDRPVPVGFLIMQTMKKYIELHYSNQIEIRCGANVKKLIHSIDKEGVKTVTGVKVEINGSNVEEYADSIILATGGFGCCRALDGLMSKYRPDLLGFPTTNGSFAQGDGVVLGETIGAKLIDMNKIQLHPTGFIDRKNPSSPTKILAPEAIRGCGGILVSSKGERFVNELDLRSVVAKAILENCSQYKDESYVGPPFAWCILSKESQELFGTPTLEFYKDRLGLFDSCADISESILINMSFC
jgi:flavocytochrome c